ncbi:MAG: DUF3592 domain-containing protein, partial [Bifidobacteriaceae bacterium]|nr:DUF3592 domain-containing protein [Bifidobacteriaceae bacterium]
MPLPPARDRSPGPRKAIQIIITVVSALALALGLVGVIAAVLAMVGGGAPSGQTARTEALVTQVTGNAGTNNGPNSSCSFGYRFVLNDKNYSGATKMSSNTYCNYQEGDRIQVSYDPAAPASNSLEGESDPG